MNYEVMSDFEINCAVGGLLGDEVYSNKDGIKHKAYRIGDRYRDVYASGWSTDVFDPCNSWSDAGPIMEEYKIGIDPECVRKNDNGGYDEVWSGVVYDEFCRVRFALCGKDKNPMKAAMITFLMLKDSK